MELDSLYISIRIEKSRLNEFFSSKPISPNKDDNWSQWWESRQMYSKTTLEIIPSYSQARIREVFDNLLKDQFFGAKEYYDEEKQHWTFAVLNFSENYLEILPMLALLKQLEGFVLEGYALIFDWMWGGDTVMAYVDFTAEGALLQTVTESYAVELKRFEEANQGLQKLAEELGAG
ncbi:hypothetical protein [Sphingobacterium sp. BIGb0116]|uniref:hypothetical protein n=1 Tax=Sphingobacterium sp. BIGb0116 TaxID=2940619 RepID=UPI00216A0763|nr:hypothetical protein [Sphingobacterium sp. BIGb0116]MCS4167662.1 hypothetical protein [Sphingobacterium sp. BIGb0116]